jgi:hypothetical protein
LAGQGAVPIIEPTELAIAQYLYKHCPMMLTGENTMPWYAWLILIIALGSIIGGLMMLRDTAKKLPLTEEQLRKVHERNAEADAKDAQDR